MALDMRVFSAIDAKLADAGLTTQSTDEQLREAFKSCVAPQRCLRLAQRMREVRRQNEGIKLPRQFINCIEVRQNNTDSSEFQVPELRELANALDNLQRSGNE